MVNNLIMKSLAPHTTLKVHMYVSIKRYIIVPSKAISKSFLKYHSTLYVMSNKTKLNSIWKNGRGIE